MATADQLEAYSTELYEALRARKTIVPLSTRSPELTIDDAYKISLGFLQKRLADGEKVVGKKIGVTSKPVQEAISGYFRDPSGTSKKVGSDLAGRGVPVLIAGAKATGATPLPTIEALPEIAPLLLVQSAYRLIATLSVRRGFDPDHPAHLRKVTETM